MASTPDSSLVFVVVGVAVVSTTFKFGIGIRYDTMHVPSKGAHGVAMCAPPPPKADIDAKAEHMSQRMDGFKYSLEQKESALHHLHRSVDRLATELNHVLEDRWALGYPRQARRPGGGHEGERGTRMAESVRCGHPRGWCGLRSASEGTGGGASPNTVCCCYGG